MSPRAFLEVTVAVPAGWQELVAEALFAPGCTGVAFGARSLAQPPPPEGCEWVRAFFPADDEALRLSLTERLGTLASATAVDELAGLALDFRRVPPEDWVNTWRKVWRPQRVGRLCVVSLDWNKPVRPGDVLLRLEPGGAFGTGRHATTRKALEALQDRLRPGERVLDAGCGSGILAVAACLLGADRAVGFDCDQNAVDHADELARGNGVEQRTEFLRGELERLAGTSAPSAGQVQLPGAPFDGLLANLYGDLVRAHADALAAQLRPAGWFVVTGCLREHREPVLAALEAAGLGVEETRNRGRWDAHVGIRRGGPPSPRPSAG